MATIVGTLAHEHPTDLTVGSAPLRSRSGRAFANLLLGLLGVAFALPLLWLVLASLDKNASWSIELPHWTFANFRDALRSGPRHALYNSLLLSVTSSLLATFVGTLAAYSLARRHIPWKGPLLLGVLFLSGVPLSILIVPIFEIYSRIGWLSLLPCSMFLAVISLPFEIFLLKNFFDAVPDDLEEAARMEGASTTQILARVVGPLAMPGIGAAGIFGFVNAWGAFLVPLILLSNGSDQPGPVALYSFIGAYKVEYGDIAAYSLIYAVPVVLLYLVFGRLFRGGFVLSGGVK